MILNYIIYEILLLILGSFLMGGLIDHMIVIHNSRRVTTIKDHKKVHFIKAD